MFRRNVFFVLKYVSFDFPTAVTEKCSFNSFNSI
jgi:hypothetical protein